MPWPMVHFAVSHQLAAGKPTPQLLLGSIAPDALHARGTTTREEKNDTHLVQNGQLAKAKLIMEKLQYYIVQQPEQAWREFVIGYFTHIYTDMRWTQTIYADFEHTYTGSDQRQAYHQEVSQIEFELQRSMQKGGYDPVKQLMQAQGYAVDPFVRKAEVERYREMKIEWLNDSRNEPHRAPVYFTVDKVDEFIARTAKELQILLQQYGIE